MDLFVWPDQYGNDETGGIEVGMGRTATKHPEVVKVGEPAGKDDPATKNWNESIYWITVVNYSGVNSGYKLKLEWAQEDLGTFPSFTRPGGSGSGGSFESGPSSAGKGSNPAAFGPGATPPEQTEIVKVPGPDGELIEVEVPVLGAQAERRQTERTSPLVWVIAAVIVLGLGTFGFLFLRKRRRAAEAAY